MPHGVIVSHLGLCDYQLTWQRMQEFTESRSATTKDEIWLLQHPPVFTQGIGCHLEPRSSCKHIPVIHTDRGGQITYHGPGQLIAYVLLDLKRGHYAPKSVISQIEQAVIDLLGSYSIPSSRWPGAPGVYIKQAKIAALGLRIKRGCCFHGLSLNVDLDLTPYHQIDPCGFRGLAITQLSEHKKNFSIEEVENDLERVLIEKFS